MSRERPTEQGLTPVNITYLPDRLPREDCKNKLLRFVYRGFTSVPFFFSEVSESCRAFSLHCIFLLNLCVDMSKATLLLVSFRVSPVGGPICCIVEFMLELKWVKTVYGLKFPPGHAMASSVAACRKWLLRFVYHDLTPAFFLGGGSV